MARRNAATRSRKATNRMANSSNSFAGMYSFRFSGFGRGPVAESFYVAGVGRMTLNADSSLTGTLFSSECPMTNGLTMKPPGFLHLEFDLSGTYAIDSDGTGTATVSFSRGGNEVQADVFQLVAADAAATRFWLISTKPTFGGAAVPELCSGEAVRL